MVGLPAYLPVIALAASAVLAAVGGAALVYARQAYRAGLRERQAIEASERERRESEQRFRDIAEVAGDWIWETDADLRFRYFSDRLEAVTGFSPDAFLGKTRKEAICSEPADPHWQAHFDDLDNRRPFRNFCYTFKDAEGKPHTFRISGKPVFDDEGRFRGYRGTGSDMTAEAQLERADAHLRAIFDNMAEGVSICDADMRVIAFNKRFLELLNFPPDAFQPGDPFEKFIRYNAERGEYGPGDVDELVRERVELAARFEPHVVERERPDGTVLEIRGEPLPGGGFVTTYADVTARKKAEKALRESERRFRDFAEVSADWFWETDLDQRYTYHSGGSPLDRFVSRPDRDRLSRAELMQQVGATPDPTPVVAEAMKHGETFQDLEFSYDHPVSGKRWVRISGGPFTDEEGRVVGYRGTGRDVTQQRADEETLRESERRYRTVCEMTSDIVYSYRLEPDGTATVEWYTGSLGDDSLVPASESGASGCWAHLAHPEDRERLEGRTQRIISGEAPVEEYRIVASDGEVRWIRTYGRPEFDPETGQAVRIVGAATDITEHKQTQEALQRSEARYALAMEGANEGLWEWTADRGAAYVSPRVRTIAHIDPGSDHIAARDWIARMHPNDRTRYRKAMRAHLKGETDVYACEYRILGDDDRYRWILDRALGVRDARGYVIRMAGSLGDITARKQAEDQLRESEALLRHAVKTANLGHWVWDETADVCVYCSEEMARMHGLSVEAYIERTRAHKHALPWIHPEDRAHYAEVIEDAQSSGHSYELEYRFVSADGQVRYGRELGEPIFDDTGRLVRIIGTLQDITELKKSEDALRRAKESAELANRTKSEFLATMSHELRTPLNAIIGFAEIMEGEVFGSIGDGRYRAYAHDIRESGTHLLNIINDILDVSKAEAGMIDLAEEDVDIGKVIESCMRLVSHKAESGKLEIDVDVPTGLPHLSADARRLKQVVLNLLSNAIKFTPSGGRITVRAREDSERFLLQVEDTGIGIDSDDLPRIMEPFTQADSTLSRKHEGTGLGLPLTRALVECHGGSIDVESAPGRGTLVSVRLPRERMIAVPAGRSRQAAFAAAGARLSSQ